MAANLVHHGAFTLEIVMPRTLKQPQGARRTHIRRAHTHFASYARNLYHLGRKFVFAHYFETEGYAELMRARARIAGESGN